MTRVDREAHRAQARQQRQQLEAEALRRLSELRAAEGYQTREGARQIERVAHQLGIGARTLYRWQSRPDWQEALQAALEAGEEVRLARLRQEQHERQAATHLRRSTASKEWWRKIKAGEIPLPAGTMWHGRRLVSIETRRRGYWS